MSDRLFRIEIVGHDSNPSYDDIAAAIKTKQSIAFVRYDRRGCRRPKLVAVYVTLIEPTDLYETIVPGRRHMYYRLQGNLATIRFGTKYEVPGVQYIGFYNTDSKTGYLEYSTIDEEEFMPSCWG